MIRSEERVGDYLLRETLGVGSFGRVVLGKHQDRSEVVAIKVLPKDVADDSALKRLSGEVATMDKAGRGCPFIVQLHEVLIGHSHIYLVMEFVNGGELFKTMFKPISPEDGAVTTSLRLPPGREVSARAYFQQLVMGVQWCHERGVAHRDLKPQNLLFSLNGLLKIAADFGFAASLSRDPGSMSSFQSMRKTMCGSPLYMAPELLSLREGCSYDALASDTWGCGAVLYGMLVGGPPFPAESYPELVRLVARPRANLRLPDRMRRDLSTLLRSMLRLEPRQRYTLTQVASSTWFRTDLARTLSRTPGFKSPFDAPLIESSKATEKRRIVSYRGALNPQRSSGDISVSVPARKCFSLKSDHPCVLVSSRHANTRSDRATPSGACSAQPIYESRQSPAPGEGFQFVHSAPMDSSASLQHRVPRLGTGMVLDSRRASGVHLVSEDLREAASGLAIRLRRLIRASQVV
eukprot:CAMPEP_0115831182 /NCGR_PEP_ID=MMETSP0287-20121206/2006_1 /TAXON_ID=412157 /ORGANISM="Chrysochromulina rotalis, Strain UIO044" /LENGTH=462 /DNA_ID=CAMNT_0003284519 /DNA_START=41 /DNA_END=1429 /DNA_ORIENTATION=-